MLDYPLYQNFVKPQFCKELYDRGLYFNVCYFWIVRDQQLELVTKAFDPDGYYDNATVNNLMDEANPATSILPAYSIKDIEKLLPRYMVEFNQKYFVRLHNIPQLKATDVRMPDAFAAMLVNCIDNDVVGLEYANMVLMGHKQEG